MPFSYKIGECLAEIFQKNFNKLWKISLLFPFYFIFKSQLSFNYETFKNNF